MGKRDGILNENHAHFVIIQGKGLISDENGHDNGTSSEEIEPESEEIYKGFFSISFSHSQKAVNG